MKPGDKVRCVRTDDVVGSLVQDGIYEVKAVHESIVCVGSFPHDGWLADRFQLVSETPGQAPEADRPAEKRRAEQFGDWAVAPEADNVWEKAYGAFPELPEPAGVGQVAFTTNVFVQPATPEPKYYVQRVVPPLDATPEPSKEAEEIFRTTYDTFGRSGVIAALQKLMDERDKAVADLRAGGDLIAEYAKMREAYRERAEAAEKNAALWRVTSDENRKRAEAAEGRANEACRQVQAQFNRAEAAEAEREEIRMRLNVEWERAKTAEARLAQLLQHAQACVRGEISFNVFASVVEEFES